MLKSKFLANSLILSVLVLGVACSSDKDSSPSATDLKKKEQEDKLNKNIAETKALLGEEKPIAAAKLDIMSELKAKDSGTVISSIDDGRKFRCAILKIKDTENQYAAHIMYTGDRTSSRYEEKINIVIPLLGMSSGITPSVPSQISYKLTDTKGWDSVITRLDEVDSSSTSSISVLRTHDNYMALIGNLNVKVKNSQGESVSLNGDLRCSVMVAKGSLLERDLNENEALKSIDIREEVKSLRDENAKKLAEIEAAKPGLLARLNARTAEINEAMRKEDEAMRQAGVEMYATASQLLGRGKDAVVSAHSSAVAKTADGIEASVNGYQAAVNQTSLAIEAGVELGTQAKNATVNGYNSAVDFTSQGIEDVVTGKARDAMILGATDLIEAGVNAGVAAKDTAVGGYQAAVNQTSLAIEAGVELGTQAKDATAAKINAGKNSVASTYQSIAESISLKWNGTLLNKASLTYKELGKNLTRSVSIKQDPSEPGYLSCRVSEETGEKRLVINLHDIKYPANSLVARISFPIDDNFVPVKGASINIDSLRNDGSKEVKSPALLTPQLGAEISDANLLTTLDGQTRQLMTYSIFADYKDEKGHQVILEGNVKCVFKK